MNFKTGARIIVLGLFAALAIPVQLGAQQTLLVGEPGKNRGPSTRRKKCRRTAGGGRHT
jgi:hypothetical protein